MSQNKSFTDEAVTEREMSIKPRTSKLRTALLLASLAGNGVLGYKAATHEDAPQQAPAAPTAAACAPFVATEHANNVAEQNKTSIALIASKKEADELKAKFAHCAPEKKAKPAARHTHKAAKNPTTTKPAAAVLDGGVEGGDSSEFGAGSYRYLHAEGPASEVAKIVDGWKTAPRR